MLDHNLKPYTYIPGWEFFKFIINYYVFTINSLFSHPSINNTIDYFIIDIVEYNATTENKYVQNGSANCHALHYLSPSATKYIILALTITPIDNIMSLIM